MTTITNIEGQDARYATLTYTDESPVTGHGVDPTRLTKKEKEYYLRGRGFLKVREMEHYNLPAGDTGPGFKVIRTGWDNVYPFYTRGFHVEELQKDEQRALYRMHKDGLITFDPNFCQFHPDVEQKAV